MFFSVGDPTYFFFFFNDTATTEIYTLSLHDALPISAAELRRAAAGLVHVRRRDLQHRGRRDLLAVVADDRDVDRKSTRLNSSHLVISYAVFCLKKKNAYQSRLPAPVPGCASRSRRTS